MDTDIAIRPITAEDTENIVRWRNSPSVVQNFIFRIPLTPEGHMRWYESRVQTGEVAQFVITEIETGFDIGSVYLRDIDHQNRKAEFGIFIGEAEVRGKGYGTKAAQLILQYAFSTLQLNRVFLRVFAENAAAIRSYEKAGFHREGVFRQDVIIDNQTYDMVFMGILKEEWEKQS